MDVSYITSVVFGYFDTIYRIMFYYSPLYNGVQLGGLDISLYYLVVAPFMFFCVMCVFKKVYKLWKA